MSADAESLVPSFEHRREDDLPEGWGYVPLGSVGTWGSGGTPSKSRTEFWDRGTVPWVSPKDMKRSFIDDAQDHITQHAVSSGAAGLVPPGTVLFVVRGMILAHTFPVGLTTREVAFNQDMRSIIPSAAVHAPYLLRVLQHEGMSILFAVKEATHGTLRLDSDTLRPWPIPLPPLPEQVRIVDGVEALLEQVKHATERLDRVPLILRRFRQAVLAAACSGELTKEWREKHPCRASQTVLEELAHKTGAAKTRRGVPESVDLPDALSAFEPPKTWAVTSVSACLRGGALIDVKDGNHGANHPKVSDFTEKGLPFITAAQVGRFTIDYDNAYKLSGAPLKRLRVGFAQPGDAILTHKGSVGRTAVCSRECVLTPQTTYYRVNSTVIDPEYLIYWFASPLFYAQLAAVMSQTTRDFVPISEQYRLFLVVPPLEEQKKIASRLRDLLVLADAIERRVQAATARADKLPQAILAKAFSGELVPTEADLARAEGRDYETAEELLARVRSRNGEETAEPRAHADVRERKSTSRSNAPRAKAAT